MTPSTSINLYNFHNENLSLVIINYYKLWRMPLVEHDLLTRPGHMNSPPDFNGVRVTRSLVLCIELCRSLFVLLSFFFCHCVVCPSIYEFWLFVWCLQTLLSWLHFTKRGCGRFWHIYIVEFPTLSIYLFASIENRKKCFLVLCQLILKL